jgi:hypothetical protein
VSQLCDSLLRIFGKPCSGSVERGLTIVAADKRALEAAAAPPHGMNSLATELER